MKKVILPMLAVALLSSCSNDDGVKKLVKVLDEPTYTSTITLSRNEQSSNEAINNFSANLIGDVSKKYSDIYKNEATNNFTISPLGITLCMGLVANSVNDEQGEQIANTLKYTSLSDFNSLCTKLQLYLPHKDNGAEMTLANSIWLGDNVTTPSSYITNINKLFYAEVYSADFMSTETVDMMNSWCAQKTNNKIKKVVSSLSEETKIMLFNALYFQGDWSSPFKKENTTNATFHGSNGDEIVSMMHKGAVTLSYFYTDDCCGVSLPFKNEKAEMIFILPDADKDIFTFSKNFDDSTWKAITDSRASTRVMLSLPRFTIEQNSVLTNLLESIGLPTTVEFSKAGISTPCGLSTQQRTFTSVYEEGATAAAVTVISGVASAGPDENVKTITFDRPFLYFIRNIETGTIIMSGRICNI
jgi:serpin B